MAFVPTIKLAKTVEQRGSKQKSVCDAVHKSWEFADQGRSRATFWWTWQKWQQDTKTRTAPWNWTQLCHDHRPILGPVYAEIAYLYIFSGSNTAPHTHWHVSSTNMFDKDDFKLDPKNGGLQARKVSVKRKFLATIPRWEL